jgi:hypothetical protein
MLMLRTVNRVLHGCGECEHEVASAVVDGIANASSL